MGQINTLVWLLLYVGILKCRLVIIIYNEYNVYCHTNRYWTFRSMFVLVMSCCLVQTKTVKEPKLWFIKWFIQCVIMFIDVVMKLSFCWKLIRLIPGLEVGCRSSVVESDNAILHTLISNLHYLTWARRVPLIKLELPTLPKHLSSPPVFNGVRVTRSLVLCVLFCRSLFAILSFFFWPLYCLSFFDVRNMITPSVSSKCS